MDVERTRQINLFARLNNSLDKNEQQVVVYQVLKRFQSDCQATLGFCDSKCRRTLKFQELSTGRLASIQKATICPAVI